MTVPLLLDTCALIWVAAGDPITESGAEALEAEEAQGADLVVTAITAWEIGMLVARGRLALTAPPETWFSTLMTAPGLTLAEHSPAILIQSSFLPGTPPRDPADRIIIATARAEGLTILTRDRMILGYADEGHVRASSC